MAASEDLKSIESTINLVLLTKWRQAFVFTYHPDDDGVVNPEKLREAKEKFMKNEKLTPDKKAEIAQIFRDGAKVSGQYEKRDYKTWLTTFKAQLDDGSLVEGVTSRRTRYFHCMDLDGGGSLDFDEFNVFAEAMGLDAESATKAFRSIDINGDGSISLDEYLGAYLKYWIDPNAAIGDIPLYGLPSDS